MALPDHLHPPGWLTARTLQDLPDSLIFHARDKLAETLMKGHFTLLSALADHVGKAGWQVHAVTFTPEGQDRAAQNPRHLHVFMDDRPAYGPNVLHSVPSYLRGFWFVDEVGTRNNSSAARAPFQASAVPVEEAKRFHAGLVRKFVARNASKFPQETRGLQPVLNGCLAFFAQDFNPPRWHHHHMTVPAMIEAAIAAKGDRALYIKPHPNQSLGEMEHLSRYHAPDSGVFVTGASIHDLLAACDVALTVTSAVGFEALLHRKPVILAGQTDFWQAAVTLTEPAAMPSALDQALTRAWMPARFLTWYLTRICYADSAEELPRLLTLLQRKGYPFADQGWF